MTINVNYRLQQINFKFGAWYGSQGFGMYELLQPEKSGFFSGGRGVLLCDSWLLAQCTVVKLGNILKTIAKSNIRFQTKKNKFDQFVISPSHVLMNKRLFLWRIWYKNLWRNNFFSRHRVFAGFAFQIVKGRKPQETLASLNFQAIKHTCIK